MSDHSNDIQALNEVFDVLSTKAPAVISNLFDVLYSPEAGKKMGQSIGSLYTTLVEAGIPEKDALLMAKDYMISFKDIQKALTNLSKKEKKDDQETDEGE